MKHDGIFVDGTDQLYLGNDGWLMLMSDELGEVCILNPKNIPEFIAWLIEEHGEYEAKRQLKEESDGQS